MASYSLEQVLSPQVILERISRLKLPGTSLSKLFGWNVGAGPIDGAMMKGNDLEGFKQGGGNVRDYAGRTGQYDIFDNTRQTSTASVPGTAATQIEAQVVGYVQFTLPRVAEALDLGYEKMHNQRPIGGPVSNFDYGGNSYIEFQTRFAAARVANTVELQTAGLIRGKYYLNNLGNVLYQGLSTSSATNEVTIDYQLPAANLNQLSTAITATWATAGSDIPDDVYAVNRKMIQETGMGLKHILVDSATMMEVLTNDNVKALAGTYNPYEYVDRTGDGEFHVRLKGMDWVTWHIIDYPIGVASPTTGAYSDVAVVPANTATFLPDPDPSWVQYIRGGEQVVEGPNGANSFQYGFYAYGYPMHNPAGWKLCTVHNGLPSLKVPKAINHATVIGF